MFLRNPRGAVRQVTGYTSQHLQGDVKTRDINLGVFCSSIQPTNIF